MFKTTETSESIDSNIDELQTENINLITHSGFITEIDHDVIRVAIIAESACSSCHAKGFCSVADQKEKVIEARNRKPTNLKVGDQVQVTMKKSLGLRAVLYGYFLPFIMMIITLLTSYELTGKQGIAGIFALMVLVPYYFVLYLLKDKLKSQFEFEVKS
ncbi:MAG: SoxR reducing system RseC family protein [Bacteroidales bacterium]|nr:SoxR reducing system RseC family protein [Bacteroidales bacterium]